VSVLLNRGDGSFSTPGIYAARPWVNHLAAADLDGDGDPDLAASCRVDDVVVTLQNGGRGRFLDGGTYPVGESPMGFAAGDLDGDGDVDLGTADGRSYTVSVLENLTLGAIRAGDPRLDVIVQAAPSGPGGISPALYDGETSEMTVWVRPGSVGTATFYVALVSALPSGGPGIGAWSLLASIDDDLEVVSVTTSGTAAEAADFAFGTHGELVDMEGTPVAQGFAANAYFEAATLPAAGTATVLKVTVRTRNTLAVGQEVRGRIDWHDGRAELYPDDTLTGIPFDNWAHIQSRRHFFCECRGLRLVFRSPGIFNLPLDPGEAIDATDILPDGLLPICEIFECPKPPLGGEPVPSADMEMGLSLFLPFPPAMVVDSWRVRLFRPEDWALEIVDPENPKSPPLTLTEFREEHLEWGSGMLGDQPGEGVNLFFPVDSKTWSAIAKQTVTVRIMNLTDGGLNAGTYWIGRLGRGALPAFRLCSTTEGDRRLDVIIQAAPRGDGGLSPIPGDGEVSEIVTPVTPGAFGEATFYVALASSLPADMPGIQGWQLTASLSGDVELTSVTTDATAAAAAGHRRATTGKLVNAVTGTSGGPGLATLVSLSLVDPATLPPVGTATVLRVTVRTAAPVPPGGEARGRLEWIDGFELVHAVGRTRFVYNAASVFNRTHFFCECRGVDLIFRPGPSHLFRFLRGDTNGDGKHDLSDSIRILERLFLDREKSICLGAADANSDQKIDLADGVFLLQFFFLGGKPPAEPFRQCGTDPGTQNFSCEISACE
jgi:hypothetical protein